MIIPRDPTKVSPLFIWLIVLLSFSTMLSPVLRLSNSNINGRFYTCSENVFTDDLPFDLIDLNVQVLPYRYKYSKVDIIDSDINHEIYIDSMINEIENPDKIVTLSYEIWEGNNTATLKEIENDLKEKYEKEKVKFDYGTTNAYWAGDCLLLIYKNSIVFFHEETTKMLIDNDFCADYLRNVFLRKLI